MPSGRRSRVAQARDCKSLHPGSIPGGASLSLVLRCPKGVIATVMSALQELHAVVLSFEGGVFEGPPEVSEDEREGLRRVGLTLWRSRKHSQTIMLHAYAALFGIPAFVREAHQRQPGRFSTDILYHAVQNTASNMWQAFYFDFDDCDRPVPRSTTPLTGVLNVLHGPHPTPSIPRRARISDLAMAFFVFQIIRAVEFLAERAGSADPVLFDLHYRHLARLVQRAGYRFPNDRERVEQLCATVDARLAGVDAETVTCWANLFKVAQRLGITLAPHQIAAFLLPCEREHFRLVMADMAVVAPSADETVVNARL